MDGIKAANFTNMAGLASPFAPALSLKLSAAQINL